MNDPASDDIRRADLVAGYRAAADLLEKYLGIPIGDSGDPLCVLILASSEARNAREVDRIAALLGVTVGYRPGSSIHYGCRIDLDGGLAYRAQTVLLARLIPQMRLTRENKEAA
jgi:hypothetical protein